MRILILNGLIALLMVLNITIAVTAIKLRVWRVWLPI